MNPMPPFGRVGLWTAGLDRLPSQQANEAAHEIEELGYGALWLSEGLIKDPFVHAAGLLSATSTLTLGTGVAVIWGRHPRLLRSQARALSDAHPDRFVLGLGASHASYVEGVLGLDYQRPLAHLREFVEHLDQPDAVLALAGIDEETIPAQPRLLAALGPQALRQAHDYAHGAITYFVTPEHTAHARSILGRDRALVVEQPVVLNGSDNPRGELPEVARQHLAGYLLAEPYQRSWQRLGFTDDDFADGGSDRLARTLIAIGLEAIAQRVRAHHAAGADHVCLQVLHTATEPPLSQWRALAALTQEHQPT